MLSSERESSFRSGMVALLGKPNVGKSTLMNLLIGQKVSIVSDKAQTTRKRIIGIHTTSEYQMVFVDTPGVHKAHTRLGQILNDVAEHSLNTDLVLVVVDCHQPPNDEDKAIAQLLKTTGWIGADGQAKPNVILCMNKMDLLKAHFVKENVEAYQKLFGTEYSMLTSLSKRQNLEKLERMIADRLPEGPLLYPEDEITDQPMRSLAAELVREKVLQKTRAEVPHAVATVVESWEDEGTLVNIRVLIVVERDGQKAIIIGKGGSMLREIGTESRLELEELIGKKVFLEMFVKVRDDWRQNPRMLHELEYTEQ